MKDKTSLLKNPQWIRLARVMRGMSQAALAKAAGLSVATIARLESTSMELVEAERVESLARALRLPTAFFLRSEFVYPTFHMQFRRRAGMAKSTLNMLSAYLNVMQAVIDTLESEYDVRHKYDLPAGGHDWSPEEYAEAVRFATETPKGPIRSMTALLENMGIFVCEIDLTPELGEGFRQFDGVRLARPRDERQIVFINNLMSTERKRFTLAHELGHILMHSVPSAEAEDEANIFAAELLFPADEAKTSLRRFTLNDLAMLKRYWRVSVKMMIYRAYKLSLINARRYQSLNVQYVQRGWNRIEPGELIPEPAVVVERLAQSYLDRWQSPVAAIERELGVNLRIFKSMLPTLEDVDYGQSESYRKPVFTISGSGIDQSGAEEGGPARIISIDE